MQVEHFLTLVLESEPTFNNFLYSTLYVDFNILEIYKTLLQNCNYMFW